MLIAQGRRHKNVKVKNLNDSLLDTVIRDEREKGDAEKHAEQDLQNPIA